MLDTTVDADCWWEQIRNKHIASCIQAVLHTLNKSKWILEYIYANFKKDEAIYSGGDGFVFSCFH